MSAVESPDVSATEENRMIAMKKFRDKFSGYPLKVVYEKIKGEIFILTAYPLKKKMGR